MSPAVRVGRGALIVFAKDPVAGRVKTRLSPPLTPAQAASLYAAMLDDVLASSAAAIRARGLAGRLAIHPPEACGAWSKRVPAPFRVVAQRGAGLSERMDHALLEAFQQGHAPLLLRGSDSPALAPEILDEALAALDRVDLVLSPDRDGGYNLVGLRRRAPGLFDHPMSTGSVLEDTLARARALGLRTQLLRQSYDIDRVEDLLCLHRDRRRGGLDALCPKTLTHLDQHRLWP